MFSYVGTTYASLSASGLENNRCFKILPRLNNFDKISSPYCYRCPCGLAYPDCQLKCVIELENLFRSQASNIAALIIEPVLASAGNIVPPEPYFSKIQMLCRDYNVLLIVDEVATGLGRCGEYFASDLFNIKPDILIVSKGLNAGYLPIGAVLFSERVVSVLADNQVIIPHGSSQDGNPIACTAAFDVLINNAGVNILRPALNITELEWDEILSVNLKGAFFCTKEAARFMIRQRKGCIINISSQFGVVGYRYRAAYSASKAGLIGLTRTLAVEWAHFNIRVNAISPTILLKENSSWFLEDNDFKNKILPNIPLGRFCKCEEVLSAVIFLSSEESGMITGQNLIVDGGWTAV